MRDPNTGIEGSPWKVPVVGRNRVGVHMICQIPFACGEAVNGTGNVTLMSPTLVDCERFTSKGNEPTPPIGKPVGTIPCPSAAVILKQTEEPGAYPPDAKVELTEL